jgi:hypothetical protein
MGPKGKHNGVAAFTSGGGGEAGTGEDLGATGVAGAGSICENKKKWEK